MARRDSPRHAPRTLQAARLRAGLSQGELGEQIGVAQNTVSDVERGRNTSEATIARIAGALSEHIDVVLAEAAKEAIASHRWRACLDRTCPSPFKGVLASPAAVVAMFEHVEAGRAAWCGWCGAVLEDRCHGVGCVAPLQVGAFCTSCGGAYWAARTRTQAGAVADGAATPGSAEQQS